MSRKYDKPLTAKEMAARPDSDIDTSDIAELDATFWDSARVEQPKTKPVVSLRMDDEVLAHFKDEFPKGYTSRMAAVLTAYVAAHKSR